MDWSIDPGQSKFGNVPLSTGKWRALLKLRPNRVLAYDIKSCTYYCNIRSCTTLKSTSRGECHGPKQVQLITTQCLTSSTQRVGCLLWSMDRIYDIWDGSLDQAQGTWVGLVPCCAQDSYRAQVTQQPIDTCRYNTIQLTLKKIF